MQMKTTIKEDIAIMLNYNDITVFLRYCCSCFFILLWSASWNIENIEAIAVVTSLASPLTRILYILGPLSISILTLDASSDSKFFILRICNKHVIHIKFFTRILITIFRQE